MLHILYITLNHSYIIHWYDGWDNMVTISQWLVGHFISATHLDRYYIIQVFSPNVR